MEIKIINPLPKERWREYKDLRLDVLEKFPQAFSTSLASAQQESDETWQNPDSNLVFAECDGRLVGMVGWFQLKREKEQHVVNIVSVYVRPEFQGKGVATQLFREVLKIIDGIPDIKKIQLSVISTQTAAIKLYESFGFQKIGLSKFALRLDGVFYDQFLMEKYL